MAKKIYRWLVALLEKIPSTGLRRSLRATRKFWEVKIGVRICHRVGHDYRDLPITITTINIDGDIVEQLAFCKRCGFIYTLTLGDSTYER